MTVEAHVRNSECTGFPVDVSCKMYSAGELELSVHDELKALPDHAIAGPA
jgi:hypothetical protein